MPILSQHRLAGVPLTKPSILVSCVEGNLHAFGTRMLSDLLNEAMYPTTLFVPPVERAAILEHCRSQRPACAALSVSMQDQFTELLATTDVLRHDGYRGLIAAGGYAITQDEPVAWKKHGIDWLRADVMEFIDWLDDQIAMPGIERKAA